MSPPNKNQLQKRSFQLLGHKTSVALEVAFWEVLEEAAREKSLSLSALLQLIDQDRTTGLASSLRVYALEVALHGNDTPFKIPG